MTNQIIPYNSRSTEGSLPYQHAVKLLEVCLFFYSIIVSIRAERVNAVLASEGPRYLQRYRSYNIRQFTISSVPSLDPP